VTRKYERRKHVGNTKLSSDLQGDNVLIPHKVVQNQKLLVEEEEVCSGRLSSSWSDTHMPVKSILHLPRNS
jgi:hypothetical protein